jgi:hypothetical protein
LGGKCVDNLPNGAACGTNDAACKSNSCVDGVCCASACSGACLACNVKGKLGTCASLAGQLSAEDCPGDATCGPGRCTSSGSCDYYRAGKTCKASTCAGGGQTTHQCSAKHACTAKVTACSPYVCNTAATACRTGCLAHADCVNGGLCDRRLAHTKTGGVGTCVSPAKVVKMGVTEEIADAVKKLTAAKPYLAIPPNTGHTKKVVLDTTVLNASTVHLVSMGTSFSMPVLWPSAAGPALTVREGVTASVQGLRIAQAKGTAGDGIHCNGTSTPKAVLSVLDSVIRINEGNGIKATGCDVTLRRNQIMDNKAGGVHLSKGAFTIVNNVVAKKGVLGTPSLGGLTLSSTVKAKIHNNTIAANTTGIVCSGGEAIVNSIIYGNYGKSQHYGGCTVQYSNVEGGATGTGNINVPPQFVDASQRDFSLKTTSGCIDKGAAVPGLSTIDITRGARVKGGKADMGAYEVK